MAQEPEILSIRVQIILKQGYTIIMKGNDRITELIKCRRWSIWNSKNMAMESPYTIGEFFLMSSLTSDLVKNPLSGVGYQL